MTILKRPLISGFTFIKHGLSLAYPIKESIESIAPLCDEVIINVGFDDPHLLQDDGTWAYLNDYFKNPKFKFLKSYWNPELKKKGLILSQQTDIALKACQGSYCQYIQGDEALHEKDFHIIEEAIREMEKNKETQGFVFNYLHFYGNTDVIKYTRNIYRREVRLIRNGLDIISHGDAQGFRHKDHSKLWCKQISATIYHYGWARPQETMKKKIQVMDKLYHGDQYDKSQNFEYERLWGLKKFTATHPKVMQEWVKKNTTGMDIMKLPLKLKAHDIGLIFSDLIEKCSGYRIGEYKNYRLL